MVIEATDTWASRATAPQATERFPEPPAPIRERTSGRSVGPVLLLIALGVLASARGGVGSAADGTALQLAGLVLIVLPPAIGVLLPGTSRSHRIVLAVALPVGLQLARLSWHPVQFGGRLSSRQSLPGLGLSPQRSAGMAVLAGSVVLALAVVLLVERITLSTRIGAVAGVIFSGTGFGVTGFGRGTGQLGFSAIAVPLVLVGVYLLASPQPGTQSGGGGGRPGARQVWRVLVLPGPAFLAAAVVTVWLPLTSGSSLARGHTPGWQQALALGSLVITGLALGPALVAARRRLSGGRSDAAVALCLAAVLYPAVPAAVLLERLGSTAPDVTRLVDRFAPVIILGVGFVIGCWLCRRPVRVWHAVAFGIGVTLTLLGGIVLGSGSFAQQLPARAEAPASTDSASTDSASTDSASTDPAGTDPAGLAASRWIAAHLPVTGRRYADRVPHPVDWRLTQDAGIQYVIADRRDAADAVRTLDGLPGVNRIYDNGSIAVYDVRGTR